MFGEEISEIGNRKGQFNMIYYGGAIVNRQPEDMAIIRQINEDRQKLFDDKKKQAA